MVGPGHGSQVEDVSIAADDGTISKGWLAKPDHMPTALVMYFGGNAEEVSFWTRLAARYGGPALLLINYRGYGERGGKPTEVELFSDAITVYDTMRKRPDILHDQIFLHGRSLGSGVAVYLATMRATAGVILTTPYDSIREVAKANYPYVPVSLLLRHSFDSVGRAKSLQVPMLCLTAKHDRVIPWPHAATLYDAWAGHKEWHLFEAGHRDISDQRGYWDNIQAFIIKTSTPSRTHRTSKP